MRIQAAHTWESGNVWQAEGTSHLPIVYNGVQFVVQAHHPAFGPLDRAIAEHGARVRGVLLHATPQDDTCNAVGSAAMDLCHHISLNSIEHMICDFLNGHIGYNRFLNLTGSVIRPSWLDLVPGGFGWTDWQRWQLMIGQWQYSTWMRLRVLYFGSIAANPARAAVEGTRLAHVLNFVVTNLRYGHRSTNRSIQRNLDPRLHRGFTVDPLMLLALFYGWLLGRDVYSAETSAAINDWGPAAAVPRLPGGRVRMSESSTPVGLTAGGNPLMGHREPIREWARGSLPIYFFFSADTIINCLILLLILWYAGMLPEGWHLALPRPDWL